MHLSVEEVPRTHAQRLGDASQHEERRISPPPFNPSHVGQIDLSFERELFLRQAAREPKLANAPSDFGSPIH